MAQGALTIDGSTVLAHRERRRLRLAEVLTSALWSLAQAAMVLPGADLGFNQATFERTQVLRG